MQYYTFCEYSHRITRKDYKASAVKRSIDLRVYRPPIAELEQKLRELYIPYTAEKIQRLYLSSDDCKRCRKGDERVECTCWTNYNCWSDPDTTYCNDCDNLTDFSNCVCCLCCNGCTDCKGCEGCDGCEGEKCRYLRECRNGDECKCVNCRNDCQDCDECYGCNREYDCEDCPSGCVKNCIIYKDCDKCIAKKTTVMEQKKDTLFSLLDLYPDVLFAVFMYSFGSNRYRDFKYRSH